MFPFKMVVLKNTEVFVKLSFNDERNSQNIPALVKAVGKLALVEADAVGRLALVEADAVGRLALVVTVNSLAAVALVEVGSAMGMPSF